MTTGEEFYLASSGGYRLHCWRWSPASSPRAIVQICHGINEYAGRYDSFARFLTTQGFLVIAHDHAGHGQTATCKEELGQWLPGDAWRRLCDDLHVCAVNERRLAPRLPFFLFGHSMGSFVVRCYPLYYQEPLAGVILSGTADQRPALLNCGLALARALIRRYGWDHRSIVLRNMVFGGYVRRFAPAANAAVWISRDQTVTEAYVRDRYCRFIPSVGMFAEVFRGMKQMATAAAFAALPASTPVLLFAGAQDPVGDCGRGVRRVYARYSAGHADVQLRLYPEGRHEMLHELNYEEVYADIAAWLQQQLPPAEVF